MNPRSTLRLTGDRCRCSACGEHFNSSSTFARHRVGKYQPHTRRCLTVAEMGAKGWLYNAAGFWITSKRPSDAVTYRANSGRRHTPLPDSGSEPIAAPSAQASPTNALLEQSPRLLACEGC